MEQQILAEVDYHEAIHDYSHFGELLHWGKAKLEAHPELYYGHGTDNPWDEALAMLIYVADYPYDVGEEVLKNQVPLRQRQDYADYIKRRIDERIPAAYLTHEAYFASLQFYINEHVLIPRSPIAELIEHQFAPWV